MLEKEVLEHSPLKLETDFTSTSLIHNLLTLCRGLQIILKRYKGLPLLGNFQALVTISHLNVLKLKVEHRELGE